MAPRRLPRALGLLLVAAAAGCFSTETKARYPQDLYHPDYVKRSKAVATFAEQQDKSQLPEAFQLLMDDDANIRLVAYATIRQLSPGGEDFGYRPYLSHDVRFGIVVRWQSWWVKNGGAGGGVAETAPPEAAPAEAPPPEEPKPDAVEPEGGGGEAAHG